MLSSSSSPRQRSCSAASTGTSEFDAARLRVPLDDRRRETERLTAPQAAAPFLDFTISVTNFWSAPPLGDFRRIAQVVTPSCDERRLGWGRSIQRTRECFSCKRVDGIETRDYLARGRHFEKLSPDQLNDGWEGAFRRWLSRHGDPRETDDYAAELRLRELELPYERVENELKIIHDENAKFGARQSGHPGKDRQIHEIEGQPTRLVAQRFRLFFAPLELLCRRVDAELPARHVLH